MINDKLNITIPVVISRSQNVRLSILGRSKGRDEVYRSNLKGGKFRIRGFHLPTGVGRRQNGGDCYLALSLLFYEWVGVRTGQSDQYLLSLVRFSAPCRFEFYV